MHSLTIAIVFMNLRSVLLDTNLEEFCSKEYFDKIEVEHLLDGRIRLSLNRLNFSYIEYGPDYYNLKYAHSWNLLIEEQSENFKKVDISYTTREFERDRGLTTYTFNSPKQCPIAMTTVWTSNNVLNKSEWNFTNFMIINDDGGLKISYPLFIIETKTIGSKIRSNTNYTNIQAFIDPSYLSSVWMFEILCKVSDKTMYVIVEEKPPKPIRRQFVARLMVEKFNDSQREKSKTIKWSYSELGFRLDVMDQTMSQFLGIDCKKYDVKDDSQIVSTQTMIVIFWVLLILAIILSTVDTALIIQRNNKKTTETVTTQEASYRRQSQLGPLFDFYDAQH